MSAAEVLHGAYEAPRAYASGQGPQPDLRPTLLVTTVDIGEGRAGRIEVRQGDDPIDVAAAFCSRHGLPEAIVLPLAQHLEDNLAESGAWPEAGQPPAGAEYRQGEGAGDGEESEEDEGYSYARLSATAAGSRSASAEPAAPHAGAAKGMPAPAGSRPGSAQAGAGSGSAPHPQPAHHLQVEPSSRSAGVLGARPPPPGEQAGPRPQTAGAALGGQPSEEQQQQGPPSYRPASIHSARGAEYFNHAPSSSGGSHPDTDGGLHYRTAGVGGAASLPAHTRLYADHFRKQQRLEEERRLRDLEIQLKTEQVHIAPASNKLASHRTAGSYRNYGERLYVEGRLEAMKKEQLAQRVKEEEARAEVEQHTFQPEISKLAQQIRQDEAECGGGAGTAYQRLYQRGATAKRQERMECIRREHDEAEVRECSFRPQINSKSARMVEQRQQILRESGIAGYDQLYNDSMRRRLKLQQLAARPPEEATFRPRVNTSSVVLKKLMEGREGEEALGGSADVAARLLERGRQYSEKLAAAQRLQEEEPRDAATGQPLFRPKTHRAPHYERNPEGTPIGEYLYSIKAEWDERAAAAAHATQRRATRDAASTYVNTRSERLVDRLKRERFRAIFDYLRRGQPAPVLNLLETVQDEVFMDTIDPEVRADIEFAGRLLARAIARRQKADLQDSACSAPDGSRAAPPPFAQSTVGELDVGGFVALMEDAIGRTRGLARQYLLPMPSSRQKFEEPSFRPAIDPHSQALAARLRPESLPAYEVLYKTAEEQAARREMMQRQAEAAKLKECLFRPVMLAQPKAREGRAMKMASELRAKGSSEGEKEPSGAGAAAPAAAPAAGPAAGPGEAGSDSDGGDAADGGSGGGEGLHFDVLERQINEALVRLSLSEEQVAASLRQVAAGEAAEVAAAEAQVAQPVDGNGFQLDFRAICGSPSPDDLLTLPECCGTAGVASSLKGFNPLDDIEEGAGAPAAAAAPAAGASVAWADDSQEVVARMIDSHTPGSDGGGGSGSGAAEELVGLDLHALASTDLPEHAGQAGAEEVARQA